MKLAEALMERADVQRRMEQLDDRLRASARTQEGEKPPEAPAALLAELDALAARQELLIRQINLTNSRTLLEGESLTALLARRDAWQKRQFPCCGIFWIPPGASPIGPAAAKLRLSARWTSPPCKRSWIRKASPSGRWMRAFRRPIWTTDISLD